MGHRGATGPTADKIYYVNKPEIIAFFCLWRVFLAGVTIFAVTIYGKVPEVPYYKFFSTLFLYYIAFFAGFEANQGQNGMIFASTVARSIFRGVWWGVRYTCTVFLAC